jgi:hypothetical protein
MLRKGETCTIGIYLRTPTTFRIFAPLIVGTRRMAYEEAINQMA